MDFVISLKPEEVEVLGCVLDKMDRNLENAEHLEALDRVHVIFTSLACENVREAVAHAPGRIDATEEVRGMICIDFPHVLNMSKGDGVSPDLSLARRIVKCLRRE